MNRFLLMSLASFALGAPAFAETAAKDAKAADKPPAAEKGEKAVPKDMKPGDKPASPGEKKASKKAADNDKPAKSQLNDQSKNNVQQQKMANCNTEAKAKGLKGNEHKKFMADCLKGANSITATGDAKALKSDAAMDAKPEDKNAQQSKMAACNADPKAKALKGDARKTFMQECLKAAPATGAMADAAKKDPENPAVKAAAIDARTDGATAPLPVVSPKPAGPAPAPAQAPAPK